MEGRSVTLKEDSGNNNLCRIDRSDSGGGSFDDPCTAKRSGEPGGVGSWVFWKLEGDLVILTVPGYPAIRKAQRCSNKLTI